KRYIRAKHDSARFESERNRDCARAAAHIQYRVTWLDTSQSSLHQVLGLGAWDENVRRYAEFAAVEFLTLGNVLRGLAPEAFVQIASVVQPSDFVQLFFRM